jgi:hypothetical protein
MLKIDILWHMYSLARTKQQRLCSLSRDVCFLTVLDNESKDAGAIRTILAEGSLPGFQLASFT